MFNFVHISCQVKGSVFVIITFLDSLVVLFSSFMCRFFNPLFWDRIFFKSIACCFLVSLKRCLFKRCSA